jgi:site-specific DNA-methyltransferase (adenine-specific)
MPLRIVETVDLRIGDLALPPHTLYRPSEDHLAAREGLLNQVGQYRALPAYRDADGKITLLLDEDIDYFMVDPDAVLRVAITDLTEDEAATVRGGEAAMIRDLIATLDTTNFEALLHKVSTDSAELSSLLDAMAVSVGVVPAGGEVGEGGDEFDVTPDEQGETRAKAGDLWVLGGVHKLLVGDCTDAANVARLMGGERAVLLLSDPPYGTGGWRREESGAGSSPKAVHVKEEWDTWPTDALRNISEQCDRVACFFASSGADEAFATFSSFKTRRLRYWKKSDPRPSFGGRIIEAVEAIIVRSHDGSALNGSGENWLEASTPRQNRDSDGTGHPYQKPIKVIEWLMNDLSDPDDLVVDPFLGSGTTLIAAHRTGRRCYGMELEPRYADVILRRAEAEGLTVEKL